MIFLKNENPLSYLFHLHGRENVRIVCKFGMSADRAICLSLLVLPSDWPAEQPPENGRFVWREALSFWM